MSMPSPKENKVVFSPGNSSPGERNSGKQVLQQETVMKKTVKTTETVIHRQEDGQDPSETDRPLLQHRYEYQQQYRNVRNETIEDKPPRTGRQGNLPSNQVGYRRNKNVESYQRNIESKRQTEIVSKYDHRENLRETHVPNKQRNQGEYAECYHSNTKFKETNIKESLDYDNNSNKTNVINNGNGEVTKVTKTEGSPNNGNSAVAKVTKREGSPKSIRRWESEYSYLSGNQGMSVWAARKPDNHDNQEEMDNDQPGEERELTLF